MDQRTLRDEMVVFGFHSISTTYIQAIGFPQEQSRNARGISAFEKSWEAK
jgi:hypothetical protein